VNYCFKYSSKQSSNYAHLQSQKTGKRYKTKYFSKKVSADKPLKIKASQRNPKAKFIFR